MKVKTIQSLSKPLFGAALLLAGVSSITGSAQAQSSVEAQARRIETLQTADSNKDGQLTRAELSAALKQRFGKMDRNGNGVVNAKDAPRFGREQFNSRVMPILEERDGNGDGDLSYDEFAKRPLENFAMGDVDGDGKVKLETLVGAIQARAS